MPTYRNTTDHTVDVPLYDLHVPAGDTFEVPDDDAAVASFDANPWFASSKAQHPDVTVPPEVAAAVTATVPVAFDPAPASPAPAPAD